MTWALFTGLLWRLWERFSYYVVAAGVVVGAFLYTFLKGRSAGQRVLKEKLRKADEKAAVRTEKIKRSVEKASDAAVNKRLEKWYRD